MGCHLNVGFLANKNGIETEININQPAFVSDLINYIIKNKVDFVKEKTYIFENAWTILDEMGYDLKSFKTPYVFTHTTNEKGSG